MIQNSNAIKTDLYTSIAEPCILADTISRTIYNNSRTIYVTVSAKKNAHIENFVTELCQFVEGGWKVIFDVKQHSQPLLRVRNRGGELI
jgi:hypothetical protein